MTRILKRAVACAGLLLCNGTALRAQNNLIFYGGPGDGWSTDTGAQSISNIFAGGAGDGTNGGFYSQPVGNLFAGGGADGFSRASYAQPVSNLFAGGGGDGWTALALVQSTGNIFGGGNADGWSAGAYVQPVPNFFLGGAADGWGGLGYTQLVPNLFTGGMGDGWAGGYAALIPLPQSFLTFDAHKKGTAGVLAWKLAQDADVESYLVERSFNAVHFTAIGSMPRGAKPEYGFVDAQPLRGHNYYRITLVKAGGGTERTPARMLYFDHPAAAGQALALFPNPATSAVTARLPADMVGGNVVVNVYSAAGTVVWSQKFTPLSGADVRIPLGGLAAGTYLVQAATDTRSERGRFVKTE